MVDGRLTDKLSAVAKFGWIAKGLLFVVIGFLGLELARRSYTTEDADQRGALALIADAPAGRLMVFVVGVGLLLFTAWEWWSAITDGDSDLLAIAQRIGRFGLGAAYTLLGVTAINVAITRRSASSSGNGPTSPEGLTTRLFEIPGGRLLTVVIGIATIIVGGAQIWMGWRSDFVDDIETDDLDHGYRRLLSALGAAGTTARAAMLGIVGSLFIVAAWRYDPDEAAGIDQSLRTIADGPLGRGLLAVTALGLAASGVYDIITFQYRRLE